MGEADVLQAWLLLTDPSSRTILPTMLVKLLLFVPRRR